MCIRDSSINTNLTASAGTHNLVLCVWDSSGAFEERTLKIDVQPVAVNIGTPANTAAVNSPVSLTATAYSPNGIVGWHVYVDSVDSFAQSVGNAIRADLAMGPGTHAVVVRAWDATGAYGDQTINVTVP